MIWWLCIVAGSAKNSSHLNASRCVASFVARFTTTTSWRLSLRWLIGLPIEFAKRQRNSLTNSVASCDQLRHLDRQRLCDIFIYWNSLYVQVLGLVSKWCQALSTFQLLSTTPTQNRDHPSCNEGSTQSLLWTHLLLPLDLAYHTCSSADDLWNAHECTNLYFILYTSSSSVQQHIFQPEELSPHWSQNKRSLLYICNRDCRT